MSLAASDRASSTSQLSTRASVRYAYRKATASDLLWAEVANEVLAGAKALIRGCDSVLGTHKVHFLVTRLRCQRRTVAG